MTQATVTSRTIAVEHIKISSKHSFEEVREKLEGTLPKYDASNGDFRCWRNGVSETTLHGSNFELLMSALGHKQTSRHH
jgi:hypothetical protein